MDVKIIRFLNGEEVIGKITENEGKYTIEKGAVIVPVGEQQLGMVPWLPHAEDNTITVDAEKVAFTFTPLTDLANQYSQNFGSGLVVPPKSPVAGGDLKFTGV
jgi:hypothetical protein|tara:strand:+ start:7139 stop:7447 length:309 start_codon:yes stop_codon:yes gene_type:complete